MYMYIIRIDRVDPKPLSQTIILVVTSDPTSSVPALLFLPS